MTKSHIVLPPQPHTLLAWTRTHASSTRARRARPAERNGAGRLGLGRGVGNIGGGGDGRADGRRGGHACFRESVVARIKVLAILSYVLESVVVARGEVEETRDRIAD